MIIIRKQCICRLVGNFNVLLFILLMTGHAFAELKPQIFPVPNYSGKGKERHWADYVFKYDKKLESDRVDGLSYMISGGLALAGGLAGAGVTHDPLERGIYALFQTIGIASIGYGAYKYQIGDEQRLVMKSLINSKDLTDEQKAAVMQSYQKEKNLIEANEKTIKAITHGLIAALNFYNASQQSQEGVKNTLTFIGGANLLASISYSF